MRASLEWVIGIPTSPRCVALILSSHGYTLLDVLRRRLLRYGIVQSPQSLEWTVEWVRKKAMHLFIHVIRGTTRPVRCLLRMIDTG